MDSDSVLEEMNRHIEQLCAIGMGYEAVTYKAMYARDAYLVSLRASAAIGAAPRDIYFAEKDAT
jgi:hypothetical protein